MSAVWLPEAKVAFLNSSAAQEALAQLGALPLRDQDTLAAVTALRRTFSADEAALLLQQAQLRRRAGAKFPHAERMYFVEEALEQATAYPIAEMRAGMLAAYSASGAWLDLGCGVGGDLLAMGAQRTAIGYELDPLRATYARANVAAVGMSGQIAVRCEDWVAALHAGSLPPAAAAFVDPARRIQGSGASRKRVFSLHQMEPPIETVQRLARRVPLVAVKVAPGVQNEEIPAECSVQFVSHDGVCKECVLWFGFPSARRWASVHDGVQWHDLDASGNAPLQGMLAAGMLLYEPDPAMIRAGALAELCLLLDAWQFDAQIAYLVSLAEEKRSRAAPFVTCFRVCEVHPFSLRLLNQRLAALGAGRVELKKRGFPVEPESLRSKLKLVRGGGEVTVIFTRRGDEHLMLLCERVDA